MMTRLVEGKSKGNIGTDRHCLNDFNSSLFETPSYEVLRGLLLPGRYTLHLLQELHPGCSYDTGIGDYVIAGAPSGNAATQWHQDWHLPNHCICVSILTDTITDDDAPMMIGFEDLVLKCTGPKGMVIMRDVSVWHRGSMHTGSRNRIMPSYRFATAAAHALGFGIKKNLRYRTAIKPHRSSGVS